MARGKRLAIATSATMAAMITLASLSMRGVNIAFPQNLGSIPVPPHIRNMDRRTRRRAVQKAERRIIAQRRRTVRMAKRRAHREAQDKERVEVDAVIRSMTNWQLTQFQKAGKTRRECTLETATDYAGMPHWKAAARVRDAYCGGVW